MLSCLYIFNVPWHCEKHLKKLSYRQCERWGDPLKFTGLDDDGDKYLIESSNIKPGPNVELSDCVHNFSQFNFQILKYTLTI